MDAESDNDEEFLDDDKTRLSHHSSHRSDSDQQSQSSQNSAGSTSMIESVKSASSKLGRKIMSSLRSEATGGNPGGRA